MMKIKKVVLLVNAGTLITLGILMSLFHWVF